MPGLNVVAISGHRNLEKLVEQVNEFQPEFVVASDEAAASQFTFPKFDQTEVLTGPDSLERIASLPEVDIVLAAIVGIAGLPSTWAAIENGKTVALANKETLVVAGHLMTELAAQSGATILPVDSEHSAVFPVFEVGAGVRSQSYYPDCQWRAISRFQNFRDAVGDRRTGIGAPNVGNGTEDYNRFCHDDEQST